MCPARAGGVAFRVVGDDARPALTAAVTLNASPTERGALFSEITPTSFRRRTVESKDDQACWTTVQEMAATHV
jgi:hypothetical protein